MPAHQRRIQKRMNVSPAEIDRLVREVLGRLQGEMRAETTATPKASQPKPDSNSGPKSSLVLRQRVIALADVEGRVELGASVAVPLAAVITPSARDFLKQQRARLERVETNNDKTSSPPNRRTLSLVVGGERIAAEPLRRIIEQAGLSVQSMPFTGVTGSIAEVADAVALGGNLGVMVTTEVAVAVCLANRRRGVRAGAVTDVADIETAINSIAMNLMIVSAAGRTTWQLQRMVQGFCTLAARPRQPKYVEVLS